MVLEGWVRFLNCSSLVIFFLKANISGLRSRKCAFSKSKASKEMSSEFLPSVSQLELVPLGIQRCGSANSTWAVHSGLISSVPCVPICWRVWEMFCVLPSLKIILTFFPFTSGLEVSRDKGSTILWLFSFTQGRLCTGQLLHFWTLMGTCSFCCLLLLGHSPSFLWLLFFCSRGSDSSSPGTWGTELSA